MKLTLLERLLALAATGTAAAVATDLSSGAQSLVTATTTEGELTLSPASLARIRSAITAHRSGTLDSESGPIFVEVSSAPLRLLIVGGVHIAQSLDALARSAGYAVTIIDPRSAFATTDRFPDTVLIHDWPDEALPALRPDPRTAIVTLSHDSKLDDPALISALRTDAFYIGALGSRRSHAARRARLAAAGFDDAAIARVHGPIGLAIGALSPVEIAISIMAEITATLRGGPLAQRPGWYDTSDSNG